MLETAVSKENVWKSQTKSIHLRHYYETTTVHTARTDLRSHRKKTRISHLPSTMCQLLDESTPNLTVVMSLKIS